MSADGDYLRTAKWVSQSIAKAVEEDSLSGAWDLFDLYPAMFKVAAEYMELSDQLRLDYLYGTDHMTPEENKRYRDIGYAIENPSAEAWREVAAGLA